MMAMKPMLFSTPMVQAIQDNRKTQTRRIIKPQPVSGIKQSVSVKSGTADGNGREVRLRYQPGDILWVRETWNFITCEQCEKSEDYSDFSPGCVTPLSDRDRYKDEYGCFVYRANYGSTEDDSFPPSLFKWRPSIHMPKESARIFLLVTDTKIERLQDITEEDARAEGITDGGCINCGEPEPCGCSKPMPCAIDSYVRLWDSLYAKRRFPFESNPWVEVTTFKKISEEDAIKHDS